MADESLDPVFHVIRTFTGSLTGPSMVGVDIADLQAVFDPDGAETLRAHFGSGEASGPNRARDAAEAALADLRRALGEG